MSPWVIAIASALGKRVAPWVKADAAKASEQPKRWRNRYGALERVEVNGKAIEPGETWLASMLHPSEGDALLWAEAEWAGVCEAVRNKIEHIDAVAVNESGEAP